MSENLRKNTKMRKSPILGDGWRLEAGQWGVVWWGVGAGQRWLLLDYRRKRCPSATEKGLGGNESLQAV